MPATLSGGQALDLPFQIPAPRLGPPTAHAGTALVAWAVEARWDIDATRDLQVVCSSVELPIEALREGKRVSLTIPADAPPTCETDGLRVDYRLRAIVDRPSVAGLMLVRFATSRTLQWLRPSGGGPRVRAMTRSRSSRP